MAPPGGSRAGPAGRPGVWALGTQEGTNAHLLARRMKRKGMAWSARRARYLAKARELVTNGGYDALAS